MSVRNYQQFMIAVYYVDMLYLHNDIFRNDIIGYAFSA